jgi:hypothetical protein
MLDLTKLWDITYLFGPNPIELSRSDKIFFVLGVLLILVSIGFKFAAVRQAGGSPKKFLQNRVFHWGLTMGILVLVWTAMRFENIPWLSVRFLALILFIVSAVWLFYILRYFLKQYRDQQKSWEEELVKKKYLAGRK